MSVPELARAVATSERTLHRELARLAGVSPSRWIREHRLRRAAEMLRRGQYRTVSEVAHAVGMSRARACTGPGVDTALGRTPRNRSQQRHFAGLATDVDRFLPALIDHADLATYHGHGEHLTVDNLGRAAEFGARLLHRRRPGPP